MMDQIISRSLLIAGLLAASAAFAQDEMPSIGSPKPAATNKAADAAGTTIIGERESPIGLYITPWRESRAEQDMDRPARLLQEKLVPIDEVVFVRQIEYYNALSQALEQKGVVTPQDR